MQRGKKSKMNNICFVLLLLVSLLPTLMAESGAADKSAATVHIVHMKPSDGQEKPEVHHIKTLAAVLGSEEAARKALVYHYTHAANGFAAKLTEKQALELTSAIACTECEGTGVNSKDHFNGQFKAGRLCWFCRGKREILCGNYNGAGFLGGFMSTFED